MSERERWVQGFMSLINEILERIKTMNEAQVLRTLQKLKASQEQQAQTLAFLSSVSIMPSEDPGDQLHALRTQLDSPARRGESDFDPAGYLEDALNQRLRALRRERR